MSKTSGKRIMRKVTIAMTFGLAVVIAILVRPETAKAILFKATGSYDITTPAGVTPTSLSGAFTVFFDVPLASIDNFGIFGPISGFLGGMSDPIMVGATTYDATSTLFGATSFIPEPSEDRLFQASITDNIGGTCSCEDDFQFRYIAPDLTFQDALLSPIVLPLVIATANSSQGGSILPAIVNGGTVIIEAVPAPAGVVLVLGPLTVLGLILRRRPT